MRLLNSMTFTVTRRAAPQNVRGKLIESEPTSINFTGNIQPHDRLETLLNVYGTDIRGAIVIFSTERLYKKEAGFDADIVTLEGTDYEVISTDRYPSLRPHWETIAVVRKGEK